VGSIYRCEVSNNPIILTEESAQINSISGSHQASKGNDDVLGIYAVSKTIQFFPKGLDKFFKNIKAFYIESWQLKEIHQSDLKVFPNLVYLYLYGNAIEVIEEGLFDFNPNLEVFGFNEPKIIHIDPNVFDHLNKLRYFLFSSVSCVKQDIYNSKEKVQEAIKVVKSNCSNPKYAPPYPQINTQLRYLESNSDFFLNLAKYPSLQTKFEDLKLSSACSNCAQLIKISALDTKVDNLNNLVIDGLKNITSSIYDPNYQQCGMNSTFDELKISQNEIKSTLGSIKFSITSHETKIGQIQDSVKAFESTLSELKNNQNELKNSLDEINKTLKTILKIC